jgi:hypothetical protein
MLVGAYLPLINWYLNSKTVSFLYFHMRCFWVWMNNIRCDKFSSVCNDGWKNRECVETWIAWKPKCPFMLLFVWLAHLLCLAVTACLWHKIIMHWSKRENSVLYTHLDADFWLLDAPEPIFNNKILKSTENNYKNAV